jgi:predicted short-subunit dehydrogenase-like oxidoreductase (DUF2520 family)
VFFIGAGTVATGLARSLSLAGGEVLGMWGRRKDALALAAAEAGVPGFSGRQPPLAEVGQAKLVILAVRDAAISEVAAMLAAGGFLDHAPVLLHCSGAVSAEAAMQPAAPMAGGYGILHPLRAMAPGVLVESFEGTTFGVQGDKAGRAAAASLCSALAGNLLPLEASQLPAYHAAAVTASNYVVALLHMAESLASAAGMDSEATRKGLMDLAEGAIAGVRREGTLAALTGPIRRGDRATVEGHLQALAEILPAATGPYTEVGQWTLGMARKCGDAEESELDDIQRVLSK